MTNQEAEFISLIWANCERYAEEYNILCTRAVVGQAIIESNWGKSLLAKRYNNFFGLKCGSRWTGKSVNLKTKEEYKAGTLTTISDNFRVYSDIPSGVRGYYEFLNTKRYENLKGIKDAKTYLTLIHQDGYATSKSYVSTVMNVIDKYVTPWVLSNQYKYTDIDKIADEVIAGLWGNGRQRKEKLTEAGYDYNVIQKIVNEKLKR